MALPISQEMIARTEQVMGVIFPSVYKMHMSRQNGGYATLDGDQWRIHPIRDTTDRRSIRRSSEDVQRETKTAIEDGLGFPPDGIAIACNDAGDILFLKREGPRASERLWVFRLRGGEVGLFAESVAALWEE